MNPPNRGHPEESALAAILMGIRRIEYTLDRVLRGIYQLKKEGLEIMANLTEITASVEESIGTSQSIIVLVNGLSELLRQNATDPAAILELANRLKTSSAAVVAAVEANPLPPQ